MKALHIIRISGLFLAIIGVIGVGVAIFSNEISLTAIYAFGTATFVGLVTANGITLYMSLKRSAENGKFENLNDQN